MFMQLTNYLCIAQSNSITVTIHWDHYSNINPTARVLLNAHAQVKLADTSAHVTYILILRGQ